MKKMMKKIAVVMAAALLGAFVTGCSMSDENPFDSNAPYGNSKSSSSESSTSGGSNGGTVSKDISLVKNEYASTPQTQVKIATGFSSVAVGDKVKVVMKGTSEKALGNAEMFIVDTTADANYWGELSEKAETTFGTSFDYTYTFTIANLPKGSGAESMMFVINGLDNDNAVTLNCSSYSVAKVTGDEGNEAENQNSEGNKDQENTENKDEGNVSSVVKTVNLVKNEYASTPQTQVKIATGFDSLAIGDKVKVVMKGTSETALGNAEFFIIDTTADAGYWGELSEKSEAKFETTFDYSYTFTIVSLPAGTGAESMMLVINGLDGDTAVALNCTEYSVTKEAGTVTPENNESGETGSEEGKAEENEAGGDNTAAALTKESIIGGIQSGENVWGSGSNITTDAGVYTVTSGTGWDPSGSATIPVCFGAGDLSSYTHIVLEADLSAFTMRGDSEDYPAIELKVANGDDSKTKVINATAAYDAAGRKAEIALSGVDFLDEASKIMFTIRGTGTVTLTDISKAK